MSDLSIGGERFLITTGGLGFYYFGSGDARIDKSVFDQIEHDSPRAAAVVAGAVVERRLEDLLKSRMVQDEVAFNEMFRPSGPLGSFSAKIHLVYLSGWLSKDAYEDVKYVNRIRNRFAHQFAADSFDDQSVKANCQNLKLIDMHVGPVPPRPDLDPEAFLLDQQTRRRPNPYIGLPDHVDRLQSARFRYVMTCQLFSFGFAEKADFPADQRKPVL